jgi:chlorite dismutase
VETHKELYFYLIIFKRNELDIEIFRQKLLKNISLMNLNIYKSINANSDYIIWANSNDPSDFVVLKEFLSNNIHSSDTNTMKSYFSIYERSPYLKNSMKIEDQIRNSKRKYLIAYPMSKSIDWYLLPYEERKRIMDEHIRVAMTDENNKDILSYTTYSFGIGDQEFVVYYETDSLYSWMKITQRLREVEARKWITMETPIYVGIRI